MGARAGRCIPGNPGKRSGFFEASHWRPFTYSIKYFIANLYGISLCFPVSVSLLLSLYVIFIFHIRDRSLAALFLNIQHFQNIRVLRCSCFCYIIHFLKGKVVPALEWIESIVNQCRKYKIPVFMKDSLADIWPHSLICEYPEELRKEISAFAFPIFF